MDIEKMPRMEKAEYDEIINDHYICRIIFKGEKHPYIAPFLYVFDGKYMYFLSTKYGKKLKYFHQNPYVSVEVENYSPDLSNFSFVSLFRTTCGGGRLGGLNDPSGRCSSSSSKPRGYQPIFCQLSAILLKIHLSQF